MTTQELQDLLGSMSLEEKVNQMNQLAGGFFAGDVVAMGPLQEMGVPEESVRLTGSVLGALGAETVKKIQKNFLESQPHRIPLLFMLDVINGFKTIFPIPLGQGATFEPELSRRCAQAAAKEAAVSGLHVTFAPMVDLVRDARHRPLDLVCIHADGLDQACVVHTHSLLRFSAYRRNPKARPSFPRFRCRRRAIKKPVGVRLCSRRLPVAPPRTGCTLSASLYRI